jgi:hypothetical protein
VGKSVLAVLLATAALFAEEPRPSPQDYYQQALRDRSLKGDAGEDFCWHARHYLDDFLQAYQAWNDTAWLDWGTKYYDFLIDRMQTGPDGYKGWIGPYMYDHSVWCDVHVGDAILFDGMLAFAEVVLKDPALKARYGQAANRYVAIARHDVIEKWDRRGTWREDGPFGAYVSWNKYLAPGNTREFRERNEISRSNLTLPFNKQNDMALVALRLFRITGEKAYRDKAEKIFSFMKSRFHYFDNHYVWNYWEPFGPWDVDLQKKATRHWVGVHPYRNYQEGEVRQIAEAYHTGIVFSQTDIERILNTNLEVMWNKDRAEPRFVNSDDTYPEAGRSASHWSPTSPYAKEGRAGVLWPALMDFNQTARDLYEKELRGKIRRAYYENVTRKRPATFARKYAQAPATLPAFPIGESRELNLAAALPSVFRASEKSILIGNSVVPGEIEVALYSKDGKTKEKVLQRSNSRGQLVLEWDGAGNTGEHRIRWTFGSGYREFPVTIR